MKKCCKCKEEKPKTEFHRNRSRPDQLNCWCKTCTSASHKQIYRRDRTKILKQHSEYAALHKKEANARSVAWRKANPEKAKAIMRKHNHGIKPEEFLSMLETQNHRCPICLNKLEKTPNVDHCHASGIVRGLLCRGCNLMLGHAKDSPALLRQAAEYLEQFPQQNAEEYQTKRQKQKRKKN